MLELALSPGLPGGSWVRLRPITGNTEAGIDPSDPASFGRLLDCLLEDCNGTTIGPGRAFDLAVCDLDRIAVALYLDRFGSLVEAQLACAHCSRAFEVSLSLAGLDRPQGIDTASDVDGPDSEGRFRLKDGLDFRLPTLRDQLGASRMDSQAARRLLLEACVPEFDPEEHSSDAIEAAMEAVGPLVSGTVPTPCPHCGSMENRRSFVIPHLLIEAIAFEQRFLYQEIHYIARAYRWSRSEILSLPTRERQRHAQLVLAERMAS